MRGSLIVGVVAISSVLSVGCRRPEADLGARDFTDGSREGASLVVEPEQLSAAKSVVPVTFPDGVAAGEVTDSTALLWTRADGPSALRVQVSTDPQFPGEATLERRVRARKSADGTAKIVVRGLESATAYHYRFLGRGDGPSSAVGRFRTAPAPDAAAPFRLVLSGDWDPLRVDGVPALGEPDVLQRMREEDADVAVLLGDIISADSEVAALLGIPAASTFADFAARWREGRAAPQFRDLLASTGTLFVRDDHEVVNNFSGIATDRTLVRNGTRAFEAYTTVPGRSGSLGYYRTLRWGSDVQVFVLDERTFRSAQLDDLASDPFPTLPAAIREAIPEEVRGALGMGVEAPAEAVDSVFDPDRTMLGKAQKRRFLDDLRASDAALKVVVNEVAMAEQFLSPYDRWEGYAAERAEILEVIASEGIEGVVFLTTDLHGVQVRDVRASALAGTPVLAREVIVGPIADLTLREQLGAVFGPELTEFFIAFSESLDPPGFSSYDGRSYASLVYDPAGGTATVEVKDAAGTVLASVQVR